MLASDPILFTPCYLVLLHASLHTLDPSYLFSAHCFSLVYDMNLQHTADINGIVICFPPFFILAPYLEAMFSFPETNTKGRTYGEISHIYFCHPIYATKDLVVTFKKT